jgi:branched-chain amino acid transport system substrate-binding protein
MKVSTRLSIALLSLLLVFPLAAVHAQEATPEATPVELTGEPVQIGIAVAQSGGSSLFGQEQVIGAELARDYFNEHGGINGRPIELVFQDAASDEAGAINAFQTLLSSEVVGIVGPTLSQQAFAADPLAEEAGVPVIAPSNTHPDIPGIGDYIARVSAPVTVVAPNAVDAALRLNPDVETVAVLYAQNDAFSSSETVVFQQVVQDRGLTMLPVQQFQTTDTDFTTQITNILPSEPDLVIISGLAVDSGNLVRQLRELGYQGPIVGGNGLNSTNMFAVCQALCEGIIVAQAYSPLAEGDVNAALVAAYEEAQERTPGQFTGQAFTAVQVFVEALRALDAEVGLDTLELADLRTQLNDTILGLTYDDTPLGPISFTEDGDIVQEQYYVAQIDMSDDGSEGQFVLIPNESE